jgi:methionyl aminopeptidase
MLKVPVKTPEQIAIMTEAGAKLAVVMLELARLAVPGTQARTIYSKAFELCKEVGGEPAVFGYRAGKLVYPRPVCLSLNGVVLHGILPDDHKFKDGDLLKIDFVLRYKGMHVDSAITVPIGEVSDERLNLVSSTLLALNRAIETVKPGSNISEIAHAVDYVALNKGFFIEQMYGGHGIGESMHEAPFIPNVPFLSNMVLEPGHVICIEPVLLEKKASLKPKQDGWSLFTDVGGFGAHFEHTVLVTENGSKVLTEWRPELWEIILGRT